MTVPLRSLLTMASSDESTIAERRGAASMWPAFSAMHGDCTPRRVTRPDTSDDFQLILGGQCGKRRMRLGLIPVRHRGDIVLQRQVATTRAPAERLDGDTQVLFEADRGDDVPPVQPEPLLRVVDAIGAHHEWQARVGRAELLVHLRLLVLEVVRPAEVIFGAGAADRRIRGVAVHEELDFALAPPAFAVHAP